MKENRFIRVSLLAIPEAPLSTITGIYDVFGFFSKVVQDTTSFSIQIVSPGHVDLNTASGLPLTAHSTINDVTDSDIVIIPSLVLNNDRWQTGRYPEVVQWLESMYDKGATLCSACSGMLLLAETGLLDNQEATIHWGYERVCRENFPAIKLQMGKTLVVSGSNQRLVMSGASSAWHDLVLYMIARYTGPASAIAIAKFFLLQWHEDGQSPYSNFQEPMEHGDGLILQAQQWMGENLDSDNPIEKVVAMSGLPERSFKRRFNKATGHTPIAYIQHLRVEEAKRQLEAGNQPFDEISHNIGYEDPAFFRRLFKRTTGLTPGAYRKKFRIPLVI